MSRFLPSSNSVKRDSSKLFSQNSSQNYTLEQELQADSLELKEDQPKKKKKPRNNKAKLEREALLRAELKLELEEEYNAKLEVQKNQQKEVLEQAKSSLKLRAVQEIELKNEIAFKLKNQLEPTIRMELKKTITPLLEEELKEILAVKLQPEIEQELKVALEPKVKKELELMLIPELKAEITAQLKGEIELELTSSLEVKIAGELEAKIREQLTEELRKEQSLLTHLSEQLTSENMPNQNHSDKPYSKTKQIVEAILFAADKPLTTKQIQTVYPEIERPELQKIQTVINSIREDYIQRPIGLQHLASGYRFQVKEGFAHWVSRLFEEKPPKYSRASLETIAIIAYRQPVTRGDIEDIRGVSVSSSIIRTLLEREWIRIIAYKEVPGRPALYGTTKQFLDYFNLMSLESLPPLDEIKDLDFSSE